MTDIERAAAILRGGGLVAFPTETVYGLGADASNPAALTRLYEVKGRPHSHPLIVHLPSAAHLSRWVRGVPEAARSLAQVFWPGPLTLVMERASGVHDLVTGGQSTVAVRVPNHPLALELLASFGGGLAAPSANRFGRLSPTTAEHVRHDLGTDVDMVLDGGPCAVGVESTIVDLSAAVPRVLRPGGITVEQLAQVLGERPQLTHRGGPRVPGTLPSHYAPATRTVLVSDAADYLKSRRLAAGVLAARPKPGNVDVGHWIELPAEPASYGHRLYAALRYLDRAGVEIIVVEVVPDRPEWLAVRDRLERAAGPPDDAGA